MTASSAGELLVRGPWIVAGYFNDDEATAAALDADGWFRTGDIVRDRPRRLSAASPTGRRT